MRIRVCFVGLLLAVSCTACGSGGPSSASPTAEWTRAYTFLAAQTKPTEMLCPWMETTTDGHGGQADHVVGFYSYADRAAWQSHLGLHLDRSSSEICEATVPVSVPNGPAVNAFLAQYDLINGPTRAPGKTGVEIDYLGQGPSFLKSAYRNTPGLYGLYLAFSAMRPDPFTQDFAKLTQPTDDATARKYLQYAQPLLAWYGYTG